MTKIKQSARGASAFTQVEDAWSRSAIEAGQLFTEQSEGSDQSWTGLVDELLRIRNLKDDWDGEGTEAPHPDLVDFAIMLAQDCQRKGAPPADRAIVGVNGTIYLEWHLPSGYQEIEITSPLDAELRWVQKGSEVAEVIRLYRHS